MCQQCVVFDVVVPVRDVHHAALHPVSEFSRPSHLHHAVRARAARPATVPLPIPVQTGHPVSTFKEYYLSH